MKTYLLNYPLLALLLVVFTVENCFSADSKKYVTTEKNSKSNFTIVESNTIASILISNKDHSSVLRVAKHLQQDLKSVTGILPSIYNESINNTSSNIIIIGTIGQSDIIDELIKNGKIESSQLSGKWEKFITQVVSNPFPGVDKALVIAGSDMRGTIYGMYDLSNQIGVSPWQWWSDVPSKIEKNLYVNSGIYTKGEPKVKYRGFFLNLTRIAGAKGNSQLSSSFQENVLELILRMNGNYLLPENLNGADLNPNSQVAFLAKSYGIFIKNVSDYVPLTKFDSDSKKINVLDFEKNNIIDNSSGPNIPLERVNVSAKTNDAFWSNNTSGIHYIKEKESLQKIGSESNSKNYGIYYNLTNPSSSLKWYNTNQIEQVWQELNSAFEFGFDKLWIVNVGNIKQKELPIEFFLDFAWDPEVWTVNELDNYYKSWAKKAFGNQYQEEIALMLKKYTQYNSRFKFNNRTSKSPYSLINYKEAAKIIEEYNVLATQAAQLYNKIQPEFRNAYYQLVLYPITASANLNELLITVEKNKLYKKQKRSSTNDLAQKILDLSIKDVKIREGYNRVLSSSNLSFYIKKAFLTQKTNQVDNFNIVKPERISLSYEASMGVTVEGSEEAFPYNNIDETQLPDFDVFNNQTYTIDIFNHGESPFDYKIKTKDNWLKINETNGKVNKETTISVSIDWRKAPKGISETSLTISGEGKNVTVYVKTNNPPYTLPEEFSSYIESNGYVSINPEKYSKAIAQKPYKWTPIPNVGRSLSGIMASPSVSVEDRTTTDGSRLEYNLHMFTRGAFKIHTVISPSFSYNEDLQFAISIDNETPQIININDDKYSGLCKNITISEKNGVRILTTEHHIQNIGEHTLTFWMVDPGVVLQKIVVETEPLKPSYFGPPESFNKINNTAITYNTNSHLK